MSAATPKVNILLSTYNGARFLQEQLDSLQSQNYPNIAIHIRDDGSTDSTFSLLQSYKGNSSHLNLIKGENIGWKQSFLELVRNCEDEPGDFYAFCDQDDIWKPGKVSRAVGRMQESPNPSRTLYCSRSILVNSELRPLRLSPIPTQLNFENAICDSAVLGCTTVFGQEIKRLLLKGNCHDMIGHDWWSYLVAAAFGEVIYDIDPQVFYRVHGSNVSTPRGGVQRLKYETKKFIEWLAKGRKEVDFLTQAEKFIETYNDSIPAEKKRIAEEFLMMVKSNKLLFRLHYLLSSKVFHNNPIDDTFLRLMLLFGCQ